MSLAEAETVTVVNRLVLKIVVEVPGVAEEEQYMQNQVSKQMAWI